MSRTPSEIACKVRERSVSPALRVEFQVQVYHLIAMESGHGICLSYFICEIRDI